ncbi:hypothetical protein OG612_02860 [Streptomyces sp. NBC_01527]|uniref:hypothetical protein n=1 Tax=Streptomyces sp. NBC_01527 TaxID=2903894 RepID=UPI00386DE78D
MTRSNPMDPRPASAAIIPAALAWHVVGGPDKLRTWALAWDDGDGYAGLLQLGLLEDLFVLTGLCYDGGVIAGAMARRSDRSVGDDDVFAPDEGTEAARPRVKDAGPVVDHERGDGLAAAVRHHFEPVGPLRIRVRGRRLSRSPWRSHGTVRRRMRCIARRRGVIAPGACRRSDDAEMP